MASTKIFGLEPAEHRLIIMRFFLTTRKSVSGISRAKKESVLETLSKFEQRSSDEEWAQTTEWFMKHQKTHRRGRLLPRIPESLDNEKQLDSSNKRRRVEEVETNEQAVGDLISRSEGERYVSKNNNDHARLESYRSKLKKRLASTNKKCSVCMEYRPTRKFSRRHLGVSCTHRNTVCKSCVSMSINTQIPDVQWDQIKCCECESILPYEVVKKYASPESFLAYDKKSLFAAFGTISAFSMCLNPSCGSGQIHDGGAEQPIMTCKNCHYKMCFTHKAPWHEGKTCEDFDVEREALNSQNEASERFIRETAKICPGPSCGTPISKNGGCDHMTCRRCGHEFCYICRASYDDIMREGNSAHEAYCKYNSTNLR